MRRFDHAIFLGLVEMVLILPILLAVGGYVLPIQDIPLWIGMLFVVGLLGFSVAPFVDRIHTVFSIAVQCVVSFGLFIMLYEISFAGIVGGLIGWFTFVRGVHYSRGSWNDFLSASSLWYGVFFYFCASVLFMAMEDHKVFLPIIYLFGSVTVIAAVIAGNSLHLRAESGFGRVTKKVSADVKRHNYIYVGLFLVGVAILWVTGIVRFIVTSLRDLILGWLTNAWKDQEGQTAPQQQTEPEQFNPIVSDRSDSTWLDMLLTVLSYIIGTALILVLLFLIVRLIWFALKKGIAAIIAYWSRRGSTANEELGYEDEKNVLFELRDLKPNFRLWNRGFKEKWAQLTDNRQRIRYLYRTLVFGAEKEGFDFRSTDTASETIRKLGRDDYILDDQSLELLGSEYNKARYGENMPSDEAIRMLSEKLKEKSRKL